MGEAGKRRQRTPASVCLCVPPSDVQMKARLRFSFIGTHSTRPARMWEWCGCRCRGLGVGSWGGLSIARLIFHLHVFLELYACQALRTKYPQCKLFFHFPEISKLDVHTGCQSYEFCILIISRIDQLETGTFSLSL